MATSRINSIVIYVSFFLVLVLVAAAIKSFFDPPQVLSNIERITQIRDDSISYWKDKYNLEHAQKQLAEGSLAELHTVYGPFMDSIMAALNIQGNDIKSLAALGITGKGTITTPVETIYVDSGKQAYTFNYKDKWINLSGKVNDKAYITYSTFDSVIITSYQKRRGIFGLGRREIYIDAYSLNPNNHISGLTGIKVSEERSKRFGLGPFVGYGWNGKELAPQIGIGLNYDLIRF